MADESQPAQGLLDAKPILQSWQEIWKGKAGSPQLLCCEEVLSPLTAPSCVLDQPAYPLHNSHCGVGTQTGTEKQPTAEQSPCGVEGHPP